MNRNRGRGSDSDSNSVVSSKSMARKKSVADVSEWPAAESGPSPKKFGSRRVSSIRSFRMDEDRKDAATPPDHQLPSGHADATYSPKRSTPKSQYNAVYSDMNPYAALRIAGTPRGKDSPGIRIADTDLNSKVSTSGNDDLNTDPYVALKIAGNQREDFGGDIIYDSNGSSGSEEDADESDDSKYEQVDVEDLVDSGSEDAYDEYANNARVSVAGSENGQGKGVGFTPGYARVSVAGSDYGRNVGRGYGRVSVTGSEPDHAKDGDEEFQEYAKVSVPASDIDYGQDTKSRGSRAGSEADNGRGSYPKVCVAGGDNYHGQDVYARLSVAGAAAGVVERDSTSYARIYVSGSEPEYGSDFDRGVSGNERLTDFQNDIDHVGEGHLSYERKTSVSDGQDKEKETGDSEYRAYLELDPELHAKLQYRVRVILISPRFELKKRTISAFLELYSSKFGVDEVPPAFSSAASLCQAIPTVVQSKQLEDNDEELILVDSSKNRRAVSCIRSGLRRIVYDSLSCVPEELTFAEFEEKCSGLLGKPLGEVLSEHGYDTPTVESLVQDMQDIACLKEADLESRVYLCPGADDPALTDGLLVRSLTMAKGAEPKRSNPEMEDSWECAKESGKRESVKIRSSVTLRSLKNEFRGSGDLEVSSLEEDFLQVRLRMRILLAFYNSGHGVEATELQKLYEKTFGQSFNLQELGFSSIMELARHWQDIFLLQEPKPGWVFLVPSQANRRILNTLRTGLRSNVFSVLVDTYPEGLEPLDFLHRLQEGMSGELWEVLEVTGYVCADAEKAESILSSSSSSDFQLIDFEEICVLLDDIMDFVRLGSNIDGSVVVKLRNGEMPLVNLLDGKLNEAADMGSFDELFVNLMMIAVDDTVIFGAEEGSSGNDGFISVGHVKSLVKSFEGSGGLRSAHSQATDSVRLKHELRLILGCPEYCASGLALNEISNIYRERTGLELGSKSKVKALLRAMPDIVSNDSLGGDIFHLCKTPKNQRILSTTRAGLRQVLFWALVKNPGGIWANLLEGWYTDFSGFSLTATLRMHGYEMSKSKPYFPVYIFLRDMSDLLQKKSAPLEVYTWAGEVKDPVHNDAILLGLSELVIQYAPLRLKVEQASKREAELGEQFVDESGPKENEDCSEAQPVEQIVDRPALSEGRMEVHLVSDAVLENSPLKEGEGIRKAKPEEPDLNTTLKDDDSGIGSNLDYQHFDKPSVEMSRVDSQSGDELGNGEIEGHVEEKGTVGDFGKPFAVSMNDDRYREQHPYSDGEDGAVSEEHEEPAEEDEIHLPQPEGDQLRSNAEAYAQLRVAGKGPKVNLDEWQFTDSEGEEVEESGDEEEEEEEEEDEGEEEEEEEGSSKTPNSIKVPGQTLPKVSSGVPKVKEAGKVSSRAWVLPNKDPWK